jgi:hypothetical protein
MESAKLRHRLFTTAHPVQCSGVQFSIMKSRLLGLVALAAAATLWHTPNCSAQDLKVRLLNMRERAR